MNRKKIFNIVMAILLVTSVIFNIYFIFGDSMLGNKSDQNSMEYDYMAPSYGKTGEESDAGQNEAGLTEMLIMNSSITITVEDNKAKDIEIRDYIKQHKGKLISSYDYQYGNLQKVYTLQVKIPQELYDDFMTYLKGIGNVDSSTENSYDVFDQYQDNALRIEMLENKLARLYELLEQAKDINDLIILENYISDTIYQIENLKGMQDRLEYESAYATVSITIKPIVKEVLEPSGLDGIFSEAFTSSLNAFLKFIEWFIRILFFTLPYALITGVGYLLYKKFRRSH